MKSVVCVVVGDGGVIVVEVDKRKKVGVLKKMIMEGTADEKDLTIYLAKKGDKRLTTGDPDVTRSPLEPVIIQKKESKMDPMYRVINFQTKTMLAKMKSTF
ncbi:hypothetical protein DVH05_019374 [Phytophthora capsici]|nr:hypothetical protein DVH05_019374 [Phytophthora capsici]